MANTKVTGDVIANGTISTVHLADDAITAAKLDSTATGITFADLTVDTDTLYVDAANNRVGIGTTLPTQALHVVGNIYSVSSGTDGGEIRLANSGGGSNWYWAARTTGLNLGELGAADGRIFIANGGDVGIGTTSPNAKTNIEDGHLLVSQSVNTTQENILLQGAGYHIGSTLYGNVSIRSNYNNSTNSGTLNFYTAASGTNTAERMRIDANGAVGIGRNTASYRLSLLSESSGTVQNGIYLSAGTGNSNHALYVENQNSSAEHLAVRGDGQIRLNASSVGRILAGTTVDNTYDRLQVIGNAWIGGNSARGIRIADGGTYASVVGINQAISTYAGLELRASGTNGQLFLSTNGNVGIGTDSPVQKLHIHNSATLTATYQKFTNGTATTGTTLGIDADGDFLINNGEAKEIKLYTNDTQRLTIQSGGNVGIGTTSPSATLHVQTAGGIKLFNDATYGYISIGSSGLTGQYPYLRLDSFRSDGSGYFWAFGHETPGGVKSIKMLINDSGNDEVTIIRSLAIGTFTANEFNGSYPSLSTGALIRSNDHSYLNGGNVGIGTTSPLSKLDARGALMVGSAAEDGNFSSTTATGMSNAESGMLEITQGWVGSASSGDTVVFRYDATQWKSWGLEWNFMSTNGMSSGFIGGYNNNSTGHSKVTHNNAHGVTVSFSNSSQNNIITFTFTTLGTHPMASFRYYQSGGDGRPYPSKASITINS